MLDPKEENKCFHIMHELHREGMTIIHITHHMDEALKRIAFYLYIKGELCNLMVTHYAFLKQFLLRIINSTTICCSFTSSNPTKNAINS